MPTNFLIYTWGWVVACGIALAIAVTTRKRCEILRREYWRFLLSPWRVATFIVASASLVYARHGHELMG